MQDFEHNHDENIEYDDFLCDFVNQPMFNHDQIMKISEFWDMDIPTTVEFLDFASIDGISDGVSIEDVRYFMFDY